jgi:hypothetical protein
MGTSGRDCLPQIRSDASQTTDQRPRVQRHHKPGARVRIILIPVVRQFG